MRMRVSKFKTFLLKSGVLGQSFIKDTQSILELF